jgi:hypothetical protein
MPTDETNNPAILPNFTHRMFTKKKPKFPHVCYSNPKG